MLSDATRRHFSSVKRVSRVNIKSLLTAMDVQSQAHLWGMIVSLKL